MSKKILARLKPGERLPGVDDGWWYRAEEFAADIRLELPDGGRLTVPPEFFETLEGGVQELPDYRHLGHVVSARVCQPHSGNAVWAWKIDGAEHLGPIWYGNLTVDRLRRELEEAVTPPSPWGG